MTKSKFLLLLILSLLIPVVLIRLSRFLKYIKRGAMNLKILLSLLILSNFSIASYKYEVVLDDLDDAWSMVFLDENTILYTELPGNLKIANLMINL